MLYVVSAGEITIFQLNEKKLAGKSLRKVRKLKKKYGCKSQLKLKFDASMNDNFATNGKSFLLPPTSTKGRGTDKDSGYQTGNSSSQISQNVLLEETSCKKKA